MAPKGAHGSPLCAFQGSFSPDLRPEEAASCGEPAADRVRGAACAEDSTQRGVWVWVERERLECVSESTQPSLRTIR